MLPGFNHNIKYQDRVYHIQTEDSGVRSASVTTLLFIGGNVIASTKTSYAAWKEELDLKHRVLEMMQTQHKAMLRGLVSGRYDQEIAARSQNAATLDGPAPINIEAGAQHRASQIVAPMGSMTGSTTAEPKPVASKAAPATAKKPPAQTPPAKKVPVPTAPAEAAPAEATRPKKKGYLGTDPTIEPLAPFLTTPAGSLPAVERYTPNKQRGAPPRAASQSTAGHPAAPAPSSHDVLEGDKLRDAFAQNEQAADDSIFGNLISPKPLDEVILSYLANNKSSDK